MFNRSSKRSLALFLALAVLFSVLAVFMSKPVTASAVSADYPAVLLRISTYDNSRHLNISGYDDKAAVDAKSYCEKYSGAQSSASNMTYASFGKAGYPSAGYTVAPSVEMSEQQPAVTTAVTTTVPVTTTTVAPPADGELVISLRPENGAGWNLKKNFAAGDKVFTDREFTYEQCRSL